MNLLKKFVGIGANKRARLTLINQNAGTYYLYQLELGLHYPSQRLSRIEYALSSNYISFSQQYNTGTYPCPSLLK